jgi:hypothetical protein
VLRCLQRPFDLNGNASLVTGSIGLAWCPQHGEDADSLLRHADTAMYAAKESGRNAWRPYHPDMTERLQQRLELERNLRRAWNTTSSSCGTSPSSTCSVVAWKGSRRCCAGATRSTAWCLRVNSFRWPSAPG